MKPFTITRPWGDFRQFTLSEPVTVKIITIKAGERISLQRHHDREEFWHVVAGEGEVIVNNKTEKVRTGDEVIVPVGATHRVIAGEADLVFLEIAKGHFDENDIERIADDYGRK